MVTAPGDTPPLPQNVVSLNGTTQQLLDRLAIRELCEGWPCHRDATEWPKLRAMFSEEAYIFTTWSGSRHIDDFISMSRQSFRDGHKIGHKCLGCTVDLASNGMRACGKLKSIIVQRFVLPTENGGVNGDGKCEVDVECQGRFVFFCSKYAEGWKADYFKVFYERDKLIPVDPRFVPEIDSDKLKTFPEGYRYLSYCQSLLGYQVLMDLPQGRGEEHDRLYNAMQAWLDENAGREKMDELLKVKRI